MANPQECAVPINEKDWDRCKDKPLIWHMVFSEFDIHRGPMMKVTYPPIQDEAFRQVIEQEFENFKNFVIPSSEICFRPMILEFNEPEHVLVGFPVEIKSDSYERFKIVYNCFFITCRDSLQRAGNSMEKACEKLASYLMDFELKHQLISKPGQIGQISQILESVYESIIKDKVCMIRTQTDVISLDLQINGGIMGIDLWKKKNKFRIPFMIRDLKEKYEEIYLHNKIFYQVLKEIKDNRNCDQIVQNTSIKLRSKQEHLKELPAAAQQKKESDPLSVNAYEILRYLENSGIIMLTDKIRPSNKYKVSFEIYSLSESKLQSQFADFQSLLRQPSRSSRAHPVLPETVHNLKLFFVQLNNGDSLGECALQQSDHTGAFYAWLFGHYKKYIRRLYEVPARALSVGPNNSEDAAVAAGVPNPMSEEHKAAMLKKVNESVRKLQKEELDYLLTFENNKDDIISTFDITETKYQKLVEVLGLKEIYVEY